MIGWTGEAWYRIWRQQEGPARGSMMIERSSIRRASPARKPSGEDHHAAQFQRRRSLVLMNAASPLPPSRRGEFLQAVLHALKDCPVLGVGVVHRAVREVQSGSSTPTRSTTRAARASAS